MIYFTEKKLLEKIDFVRQQEREQIETIEQAKLALQEGQIMTAESLLLSLPIVCKTAELERESMKVWSLLNVIKESNS